MPDAPEPVEALRLNHLLVQPTSEPGVDEKAWKRALAVDHGGLRRHVRYRRACRCGRCSRDAPLINATIHAMNDAFETATWIYIAMHCDGVRTMPENRRVEVPTALALYPDPRMIIRRGARRRRVTR